MVKQSTLEDSDTLFSFFQRTRVYAAWEQYLGLEHLANSPKRGSVRSQSKISHGSSKEAHGPCNCGKPKCCGAGKGNKKKHIWDCSNQELFDSFDEEDQDQVLVKDDEFYNKLRLYMKQVYESEGFDFDEYPGSIVGMTHIFPAVGSHFEEDHKVYEKLANAAIKLYNYQNGTHFAVDRVERVNLWVTNYIIYYVTFTASDEKKIQKIFQTQISVCKVGLEAGDTDVIFCRLKPGQ